MPRHPGRSSIFARFLMLALFLIATIALVFGVLTILNRQTGGDVEKNPATLGPVKPANDDTSAKPPSPRNNSLSALPTPSPPQPTLIEPPPDLPEGIEPKSPGMEALEVLEAFLAAQTLDERLPMIETKTPEEELRVSCLAGRLPPVKSALIDAQESNPLEEVVDFYYNVDFEGEDQRADPHTILVRTRGSSAPKVVVDPFLDLFGGRLAAYASTPSEKGATFQVIAYAVATCTDPKIPNREKKLTLKLLPRDNTKEIAEAYFGRLSAIGEMLEDGTYSLSYGKAKSCTVMLAWNTEDNPDYPYLEAVKIVTLDWNP